MILETFPVGPLQCNCSILGDEVSREAIVVDPGENIPYILTRLAAHHLTVKQIIITHAHIDHVGGAAKLKQITGAPILMNENDLPMLHQMDAQAGWLGVPTPQTVAPDESAKDRMVVGLSSLRGEILHTPGHTPGSICIHFPEHSLLLSGDTLFAGTIGRTDLPGGDTQQILRSLREKLISLPEQTRVVPGHGRSTTIGEERESNPFLRPGVSLNSIE